MGRLSATSETAGKAEPNTAAATSTASGAAAATGTTGAAGAAARIGPDYTAARDDADGRPRPRGRRRRRGQALGLRPSVRSCGRGSTGEAAT